MGELEALRRACPREVLRAQDSLDAAGAEKAQHLTGTGLGPVSCT